MTRIGKSMLMTFLCSFLIPVLTWAATVTVQSTVDRNDMGMGDTLTLTVSVISDDSVDVVEPKVANMDEFELVNSWNSSSTSSKLMQGQGGMQFQTVRTQDFNYMITPKKTGNLTVPAFDVQVDGKTYATKPITIHVSKHGSGAATPPPNSGFGQNNGMPPDMQDEMDQAEQMFNQLLQHRQAPTAPPSRSLPKNPNEAFFVQCDVDKTDVYEGEQITVNWYIYTRGNIISLDRVKFPELRGFWKEIIEEVPALNFTEEIVNGIPYRKALLASHALFPIKPGTATIDPYRIKAQVQIPTSPFSAFGFGKAYTFTRASDEIKIHVKPLPVEGRPSDFSGAVGQFEVTAKVDGGNQFPVNQPFSLKVRFEGRGNAKLIELPSLNLPTGIEVYNTKSDSKFFKNGKSYKEFEVLIIPRQEGDLEIPAMSFSEFDPQQKRYVTKRTDPIRLKIVANPNAGVGNQAAAAAGVAAAVPVAGATATTMPKKPQLPSVLMSWDSAGAFSAPGKQWGIWGAVFALLLIVLVWKARRELGVGEKQRNLREDIDKRMKRVQQAIDKNDWRKTGTEMTNLIYHVLGVITGQGGAHLEIGRLLDQAPPSLRRELGADLSHWIDVFQIMSFAPESVVGKLKDKAEMKKNTDQAAAVLIKAVKLGENRVSTERERES
jgi:hypothetical protein